MNPICNSVHVRVPATSANLGSGFDTVGLALDYHDELTFTLNDDPNDGIAHVIIHGEGADTLPRDETHLVVSTFRRACATFGLGRLGFTLEATNNIPQARGMGSSAEAIVAGIAARPRPSPRPVTSTVRPSSIWPPRLKDTRTMWPRLCSVA